MCSIANLFDTNIREFDAKKRISCPECLDCVDHEENSIFLKKKISILEVKL